jgi:choline dehydrogenase-like flavoprotein
VSRPEAGSHHVADVVVVGSGAGGATTAAVVAEAGFDVLVLEEGADVRQGEVVPFSLEQMDRQYRAGGVTAAIGFPSIAYTEGCCVGGGTEVNSGLYRRPPEEVLDRWRTAYDIAGFDTAELYAICDEVERELAVQTVPGAQTAPSEAMRRGAAGLGWRHEEIPRWMTYEHGTDARSGRRRSMTETYLPRAVAAGARILSGHRVDRLVLDGGRATRLLATGSDRRPVTIDARHVVVCGGAIQTPALLQRSGLRHRIGRSLAVHPTVKLTARFPDELNVVDDVPVFQVKEFAPDLSFGGSASGPGLAALALSDSWARSGAAIEDWRRLAVYYAAITSEGRGAVRALPGLRDPLVTYRLTTRDRQLLGRGMARLALLMLEAGATEVHPSYRGAPVVRSRADLATLAATFAAGRASLMTVHLCSTVPIGDGPRSATDSFGLVRGTSNVFVNDASLLPDAPGVNPQGSVMALAIRNARHFVDTTKAAS